MMPASQKVDKISLYLVIYVTLMVLLVATVAASEFNLGDGNVMIALVIAVA
jgi:caa(3)-type oxidase subunit IV